MPIDCSDGPPGLALSDKSIEISSPGIKSPKIPTSAAIGQLSRTAVSKDCASILILDSDGDVIMKYNRTEIEGSLPIYFTYFLHEEDVLELYSHIGTKITIKTTIYNIITGKKVSTDSTEYLLSE